MNSGLHNSTRSKGGRGYQFVNYIVLLGVTTLCTCTNSAVPIVDGYGSAQYFRVCSPRHSDRSPDGVLVLKSDQRIALVRVRSPMGEQFEMCAYGLA